MHAKTCSILILAPLLGGLLTISEKLNVRISISERRLQTKLNDLFPIEGKRYGLSYRADTPYLRLKNDGLVHFGCLLSVYYLGQQAQAYIEFAGKPIYQKSSKDFYIVDLTLVSLRWVPRYDQDSRKGQEESRSSDHALPPGLAITSSDTRTNEPDKTFQQSISAVRSILNIDNDKLEQIKHEAIQKISDYLLKRLRERLARQAIYTLSGQSVSERILAGTMSGLHVEKGTLKLEFAWLNPVQTTLAGATIGLSLALLLLGKPGRHHKG